MNGRVILHSDANSFYASVETVLHPEYRGKAIAVCGSVEDRHGIVLAKSEKAKKAGVKTGMANHQAQSLCPELIIVHPTYGYYLEYSRLLRDIYYRYTDYVEPYGMDECWLDVSDNVPAFGSPYEIAEKIRSSVESELGITVSIGVSFNKIFAKLGSDMKKPNAVTVIDRSNYKEKVWALSVSEILYVGRATEKKLRERGIYTVGDLAKVDPESLKSFLGVNGVTLWQFANGLDNSRVMHRDFVSPVKSIGHGSTGKSDLSDNDDVWKALLSLSQEVGTKLRSDKLAATGVQITVRDIDLDFKQYQCRTDFPTQSQLLLARTAYKLFTSSYKWKKAVRSITITAINLIPQNSEFQTDMFTDYESSERHCKVEHTVDLIRERFGKRAVMPATLVCERLPCIPIPNGIDMPGMMYR